MAKWKSQLHRRDTSTIANELIKGETFVDGEVVTGARLNNMVDLGRALKGIILEQPLKLALVNGDGLLVYNSEAVPPDLARAAVGSLPGVDSVGLAMPTSEFTVTNSPITTAGTITAAWKPQPGNKFFAGNGTGTGGTPTFRPIAAHDIALVSVEITAANNIDWSLGNVFHKTINTETFLTFSNIQDGQTIKVLIGQDGTGGRIVHFPAHIWWKGSAYPVQQKIPNAADIWEFVSYGGAVLGQGDMNYRLID
jgi:hypothetical protein